MTEKLTTPLRYDAPEDVKMRLDGTYLRYKGEVVHCNYHSHLKVYLTGVHPNTTIPPETVIHSSNVDLDISSLPLGFLVFEGQYYPTVARRAPYRKYKQGVCSSNVTFEDWTRGKSYSDGYFGTSEFKKMLTGQYRTYAKAMLMMAAKSELTSCPISRDFCVLRLKDKVFLIDSQFEEVGEIKDGALSVNDWWYTPTMVDRLRMLGVVIKEN